MLSTAKDITVVGEGGSGKEALVLAERLDPHVIVMDLSMPEMDGLTATRELLIPQTTLLLLSAVELSRLAETWREPSAGDTLMADAMHLIGMGCEYVLVTGTPGDVHDVVNSLFNDTGLVRQDRWQRISGNFAGAGTTISATAAAMLANGQDVPEAVFEAQEFVMASIAHAQRLGMGKLVPDRYFWAREPEADH